MLYIITLLGLAAMAFVGTQRLTRGVGLPLLAAVLASGAITLVFSIKIINAGYVGVPRLFGEIQDRTLTEGVNFKNPLAGVSVQPIRRQNIEMTSGSGMDVISKDRVKLRIDMSLPYRVDGDAYPNLLRRLGERGMHELLISAARSATRAGAAEYTWSEIAVTRKDEFSATVQEQFGELIKRDLMANQYDAASAEKVFTIVEPKLRNVLPPDRISASISQRLAAEEDLKKQKTITKIAEEEANRRANEGLGVANLFEKLPEGFSAGEIQQVLSAIADKTRADAMMAGVESGKIQLMVLNGAPATVAVK